MHKRFYVFFCRGVMPWYLKLLDSDISHCFTLEHQLLGGYDHLIRVENLTNVVEVTTYFAPLKEVMMLFPHDMKMLTIDVEVDPLIPHNPLGIIECVSLTKKLLGINQPFILTPLQLYKFLKGKIT